MSIESRKELAEMAGSEVLYGKKIRIGIRLYEVMVTRREGVVVLNMIGPDGKGYELNFENSDIICGWIIEGRSLRDMRIRYIKPESIERFINEYHKYISKLSKSLPKEVAHEVSSLFTKTSKELEAKLKDWEVKAVLSKDTRFMGYENPY